jgi:repressor LexA
VSEPSLTKRQREVLAVIERYASANGYPPTVRDIGRALGLTSSSTVHSHLANLEELGFLRRNPAKPRALELVGRARESLSGRLPLVGRVPAGEPVLAEENIEDYLEVPAIAGGEEGRFVLRVSGDSMREAGILEGDYVVVHPQETATDGDIVVALIGDEATVKRFFRESDHVRLQPENPSWEPIRTGEVDLVGRVVGVCRRVG